MMHLISRASAGCVLIVLLCAGCATQRTADIRVDMAPDANLSSYSTFGFPEQTGTDRGGYSTIVTDYFKAAVKEQMEMRGYRYVDANPSLLVNFYANVRERTEVRSRPGGSVGFGYYGYRYGLYDAWPMYGRDIDTVTYPIGTANIDVVDAKKRQLIWEGVAEGRLTEQDMDNPRDAIASAVAQLFARFPGKAGSVDTTTR
ncbi:DUF4136 domain-containing protein [Steroidobacter sp. S1-65]|uniref:DUF4136 domain-containing protein n=1 Tax=Steroidobacter gossypii TaxID=2805490 RepID=A0ABS1WYC4_9GAMM|nr:DUF4136 domain-containing protein [Steroidobacter gossypii]MBM0105927.1 DUF4136 domain-containing protein [Steroidobacter gossypii]